MKAEPGDTIILEKLNVDSGYRIEKSVFNKTFKITKNKKNNANYSI